jgi:Core-2/I-Branching enzyme
VTRGDVADSGSFGHVRATLKGLANALEQPAASDYVVLLTAQDYPLRSSTCIEQYRERRQSVVHEPLAAPFSSLETSELASAETG